MVHRGCGVTEFYGWARQRNANTSSLAMFNQTAVRQWAKETAECIPASGYGLPLDALLLFCVPLCVPLCVCVCACVCVCVCVCVFASACASVCLPVCLSVNLSGYVHVRISYICWSGQI